MPLASYVLSLCLHVLIILIIWFWPAGKPLINLEQPVMISLVDGAPGGNKTPSPILGPMGAKAEGEPAPAPAAQQADVAASEREATKASEIKAPKDEKPMLKEEPKKPELKPEPKKEPEPKEKPVSPKKREEVRKPEPKKEEEKPKPEPKKPQEEKKDKKQTTAGRDQKSSERKAKEDKDAIAGALNQAGVFGENVLDDRERKVVRKMAAQVGVSYTAMLIRLKELDLLEYHPLREYLDRAIPGGVK